MLVRPCCCPAQAADTSAKRCLTSAMSASGPSPPAALSRRSRQERERGTHDTLLWLPPTQRWRLKICTDTVTFPRSNTMHANCAGGHRSLQRVSENHGTIAAPCAQAAHDQVTWTQTTFITASSSPGFTSRPNAGSPSHDLQSPFGTAATWGLLVAGSLPVPQVEALRVADHPQLLPGLPIHAHASHRRVQVQRRLHSAWWIHWRPQPQTLLEQPWNALKRPQQVLLLSGQQQLALLKCKGRQARVMTNRQGCIVSSSTTTGTALCYMPEDPSRGHPGWNPSPCRQGVRDCSVAQVIPGRRRPRPGRR